MERRKPLQAKTGLTRSNTLKRAPLSSLPGGRGTPVSAKARKPIKARSAKMDAIYVERRKLVARMLAAKPWCEACALIAPFGSRRHGGNEPMESSGAVSGVLTLRPSVDIHEVLTRGRYGNTAKAILDETNCLAVCRICHDWIGNNPTKALALGLVKNSWDRPTQE